MTTEPTMPTYRTETCRRCKGSGEYSFGFCYGCQGRGVVQVESGLRPMTDAERTDWMDYLHVQAFREDRARARAARRGQS